MVNYSNEFDLSADILQTTVTVKEKLVHKLKNILGSCLNASPEIIAAGNNGSSNNAYCTYISSEV